MIETTLYLMDMMDMFHVIQKAMELTSEEKADRTYEYLLEEYRQLKAKLEVAGVNLTEIDRLKIQ